MDIGIWIVVDTLLLTLNIIYVGVKVFYLSRQIPLTTKIAIFLLVLFFVFPLGLMPVGVRSLVDLLDIPRNWFWHFKVTGVALADLLLILFFIMGFSKLFLKLRCNKYIFAYCLFAILIFFQGVFSAFYFNQDVDVKNILNALRSFLIIIYFLYFGYLSISTNGYKIFKLLSSCLFVTFIISFFSMIMLKAEFRATRYWIPAMLQSQQYVSVIPFLFIIFGVSRKESGENLWHFRMWSIAAIAMLFMGYKAFYLLIVLFIIFYLFSKLLLKVMRKSWGIVLFIFIILLQPLMLFINYTYMGIAAIDTRAFQVLNSMKTLQNSGIMATLFGIGWGQWYTLYFDFPTIDHGAWTVEQLLDESRKFSIQLVPFSLVRSIGLVGFILVFLAIALYIWKISKAIKSNKCYSYIIFVTILINLSTFIAIPDVLPESIAFSAFFVGATRALLQKNSCESDINYGH